MDLFGVALDMAVQSLLAPLSWFARLLESGGAFSLYLGLSAASIICARLISPIIGGRERGRAGDD